MQLKVIDAVANFAATIEAAVTATTTLRLVISIFDRKECMQRLQLGTLMCVAEVRVI